MGHHGVYTRHAIFLLHLIQLHLLHSALLKRFKHKVSSARVPHWCSWDRALIPPIPPIHKCIIKTSTWQIGAFEVVAARECIKFINRLSNKMLRLHHILLIQPIIWFDTAIAEILTANLRILFMNLRLVIRNISECGLLNLKLIPQPLHLRVVILRSYNSSWQLAIEFI
jgi:hypothetical protein